MTETKLFATYPHFDLEDKVNLPQRMDIDASISDSREESASSVVNREDPITTWLVVVGNSE